jgi:hypothetical protein
MVVVGRAGAAAAIETRRPGMIVCARCSSFLDLEKGPFAGVRQMWTP